MVTRIAFAALVLLIAVQRLVELRISRDNERQLLLLGAREHAPGHFRLMQLVHGSWLLGSLAEVLWVKPPFVPWLAVLGLITLSAGQLLRLSARRALGFRWTVRILTLPETVPVTTGIYRYLRHPNYLGVILEIAALPLVHSAYRSAILFTLLNAVVLAVRIPREERALAGSSEEYARFAKRPRFIPAARSTL